MRGGPGFGAFAQAEKLRSEWWSGSTERSGAAQRAPKIPDMPTGLVEVYVTESRFWDPPPNCPCLCSASKTIRKTCGCAIDSSILRREKLHQNIMLRGKSSIPSARA